MFLKRVEKKKLWRRYNKVAKWFNCFQKIEKQPTEVLYKKLFYKKQRNIYSANRKAPALESLFNSEYWKIFKSTYIKEHLQTVGSENVFVHKTQKNLKLFIRSFNFTFKKRFFQHQYQKQVKMFFISWLVSYAFCIHIQYFFVVVRNKSRKQ